MTTEDIPTRFPETVNHDGKAAVFVNGVNISAATVEIYISTVRPPEMNAIAARTFSRLDPQTLTEQIEAVRNLVSDNDLIRRAPDRRQGSRDPNAHRRGFEAWVPNDTETDSI